MSFRELLEKYSAKHSAGFKRLEFGEGVSVVYNIEKLDKGYFELNYGDREGVQIKFKGKDVIDEIEKLTNIKINRKDSNVIKFLERLPKQEETRAQK